MGTEGGDCTYSYRPSPCSLTAYMSLHPVTSPSLIHATDGAFSVCRPELSSSLASSHPPVPIAAAALRFTFIRRCRCAGWFKRPGSRLSAILGQTGGPTQQQVGTIVRVLGGEKRGRRDNNGREAREGGGGLNMKCRCDDSAKG